ncbi:toxin-like protein 14 [Stegodyphus dumicola]|uniref:toxin-like protein 14 n=1 Tax=Stegodyphus dumicola TaxID=202533 RepID=UPI0015B0F22A|nr:toxin-like protein 14 [Stegodyphus dumicola]
MARWFVFFTFALMVTVILEVHGDVFVQQLNTDSGFCEGQEYGRIQVGEVSYNDEKCLQFSCTEGFLHRIGCGQINVPGGCHVVEGAGHYPDCCPKVDCGSQN